MAKWAVSEVVTAAKLNSVGLQSATLILNGTVSYSAPANCTNLDIDAIAGGGGGGGCATAATASGSGAAGGGGGYAYKHLTTNIGTHTVAVGAAGTGGTAGANNGTVGGNTTFADTTAAVVAQANGGNFGTGQTAVVTLNTWLGGAFAGGTATVGDILVSGGYALLGQTFGVITTVVGTAGGEASGPFSGKGGIMRSTAGAGNVGGIYGGGGAGGVVINGSASVAGGNGANGGMLVRAYG